MTTESTPYVWFCRECKRKGDMFGNEIPDLTMAMEQHKVSSPDCGNLIRTASREETEKDPKINEFRDWADD
jgi:hypothetical protein